MTPTRLRSLSRLAALGVAIAALALVLFTPDGPDKSRGGRESNFLRLLRLIPDTPETRFDVALVDYDRFFASLQVNRPLPNGTRAQDEQLWSDLGAASRVHGYTLSLGYSGNLGILSGMSAYSRAISASAFGYGLADVDAYVLAGRDASGYEAVVGRFDADRVEEHISQCADCGLEAVKHDFAGMSYYAWGDDFRPDLRKRLQAPLDEMGVGGRLAGSSEHVMRTEWSLGMEQMLDTASGNRRSLADDPDVVMMVKALDSMQAISAYISYCTWSWPRVVEYQRAMIAQDDGLIRLIRQSSGDEAADTAKKPVTDFLNRIIDNTPPAGLLVAYQAYSVATGLRNGEPFTALMLLQATPDQAKENAARLRARLGSTVTAYGRPWPDASTVDISISGHIVTARFPRAVLPYELLRSVNLLAWQ